MQGIQRKVGRKKAQEGGGGTSDGLCSRQGQFKGWVEAATGGSSQEADGTPEALGAGLSRGWCGMPQEAHSPHPASVLDHQLPYPQKVNSKYLMNEVSEVRGLNIR